MRGTISNEPEALNAPARWMETHNTYRWDAHVMGIRLEMARKASMVDRVMGTMAGRARSAR